MPLITANTLLGQAPRKLASQSEKFIGSFWLFFLISVMRYDIFKQTMWTKCGGKIPSCYVCPNKCETKQNDFTDYCCVFLATLTVYILHDNSSAVLNTRWLFRSGVRLCVTQTKWFLPEDPAANLNPSPTTTTTVEMIYCCFPSNSLIVCCFLSLKHLFVERDNKRDSRKLRGTLVVVNLVKYLYFTDPFLSPQSWM